MKFKDRLVRKLLNFGKKHRIMVYPILALVAVITAIDNIVIYTKKNKKRFAASVTVMALLLTQSLFLTSSADTTGGGSETETDASQDADADAGFVIQNSEVNMLGSIQPDSDDPTKVVPDLTVTVVACYKDNGSDTVTEHEYPITVAPTTTDNTDYPYQYTIPDSSTFISRIDGATTASFSASGYYSSAADSYNASANETGTVDKVYNITQDDVNNEKCREIVPEKVYFSIKRNTFSHTVNLINEKDDILNTSNKTGALAPYTMNQGWGDVYPEFTYGIRNDYDADVFYSYGRKFAGFTVNGTTKAPLSDVEYTIMPNETDSDWVLAWSPMSYDIKYDFKTGAPEAIKTAKPDLPDAYEQTGLTYSSTTYNLMGQDDIKNTVGEDLYNNTGWYISAWKYGDKSAEPGAAVAGNSLMLVSAGDDIKADNNITGNTLRAVWSYRNVELEVSNATNCSVNPTTGNSITVTGTYGDTISFDLTAKYKTDGAGSAFTFEELKAEYKNLLNAIGLDVATRDSNQTMHISGQLKDVTASTGIASTVVVDDGNVATSGENEVTHTSSHTLTIVSNQREITINTDTIYANDQKNSVPNKIYDGTNSITVYNQADLMDADKAEFGGTKDNIYVTFNSNATLDNPNAGGSSGTPTKTITLDNVALAGESAKLSCYKLVSGSGYTLSGTSATVPDKAYVDTKQIELTFELSSSESDSVVLFGEKEPRYVLRVKNVDDLPEPLKSAYNGCTSDDSFDSFFKTYFGYTGNTTSRVIYSAPGQTYDIKPDFTGSGTINYIASNTASLQKSFSVERNTPAIGTHYKYEQTKVGDFYPGLTITPIADSGYTKIRRLDSADDGIAPTSSKATVEGSFKDSITIEDCENKTIYFELLNPTTGAITTVKSDEVSVDTTKPVFYSFKVMKPSQTYFNEFGFGSYYHSQNVDDENVERVTIRVTFEKKGSDLDVLKYMYTDENGKNRADSETTVVMTKDSNNPNLFNAEFTIGTGNYGQIVLYAVDKTGNSSDTNKLRMNDHVENPVDYSGAEKDDPTKYFEWMVENVIMGVPINVKNEAGDTVVPGTTWQNYLNFTAFAQEGSNDDTYDDYSGLWKIEWIITGPNGTLPTITQLATDTDSASAIKKVYGKYKKALFTNILDSDTLDAGEYKVKAILYDNAGNKVELAEVGSFLLDTKAPRVVDNTVLPSGSSYVSNVVFKVNVSEPVDESGVALVRLFKKGTGSDPNELLKTFTLADDENYEYSIISNGTYILEATDVAGNVKAYERTFTGISDIVPADPTLTVSGTKGNNGWYISVYPKGTLTYNNKTSDNVPVDAYYKILSGNKSDEKKAGNSPFEFDIEHQGEVALEAYAISQSGVKSNTVSDSIKIDTVKPEIVITQAAADNNGNIVVNFTVSDVTSGVDTDKVYVNGEPVDVTENGQVVNGSFTCPVATEYIIEARDNAGNMSEPLAFTPLAMEVAPVTEITTNSANIEAIVTEGTYPVNNTSIKYWKRGSSDVKRAVYSTDRNGNVLTLDAVIKNLDADTVYEYEVYAITSTSKETKTVSGSFKTLSNKSTGTVYGNVAYSSDSNQLSDSFKTYPIYVSLMEGDTYITTKVFNSEEDLANAPDFTFTQLADGTYRVVATNGLLTDTATVTVSGGGVIYPDNYGTEGGVNLVLSGFSTRVVIDDGVIGVSADKLDDIFADSAWTNFNISASDIAEVKNGGRVVLELHASYTTVESIEGEEKSTFAANLGKDAKIHKYIYLDVIKKVYGASGELKYSEPIHNTTSPLTVSFPLEELSGQDVHVAAVHKDGSNYLFRNFANAAVTNTFVTITTDEFSVYALYTLKAPEPVYHVVQWIDGNGKVLLIDSVLEGTAAVPPAETPVKSPDSKYVYTFDGWDLDYSNVTKDMIIQATFIATEKDKPADDPAKPDGDKPSGDTPSGDTPGGKPADVTPSGGASGPSSTIHNSPTKYTYLGSASSPSTGDNTPIVVMVVLMIVSLLAIIFVMRAKDKE